MAGGGKALSHVGVSRGLTSASAPRRREMLPPSGTVCPPVMERARPAFPDRSPRLLPTVVLATVLLSGCKAGPLTRVVVDEHFSIEPVGDSSKQTRGSVTVEDLGEPADIAAPVRVQACKGRRLQFVRVKSVGPKGKIRIRRRPVYEEVNPLEGLYVRRLKIRNDSGHILSLNRIEAVLVDAAGNDNEGLSRAMAGRFLLRARPCPSTRGIVASLRSLKFLGSNIRLRPGRVTRVFVAFSGIDKRIPGDWYLELHGFPVRTDPAGKVSRVASFNFPLVSRGYRTTVEMRKDTAFGPWKTIKRTTKPVGPAS